MQFFVIICIFLLIIVYYRYCSLVAFREAFFVNIVHRKPENCGAKSCVCMISVHREAVAGNEVNSNLFSTNGNRVFL